MKYLMRFLETSKNGNPKSERPTKPTEPGFVSQDFEDSLEEGTYKTYETPLSWRALVESWPSAVRAVWVERAAIMHFDGRLPLPQAEYRAFQEVASCSVTAKNWGWRNFRDFG
jgi:hypothetical protein